MSDGKINWADLAGPASTFESLEELLSQLRADLAANVTDVTYTALVETGKSRYTWELWPDRFRATPYWECRGTNLTTGEVSSWNQLGFKRVAISGVYLKAISEVVPLNAVWHRSTMEKPLNFIKERDRVYLLGCAESPLLKLGYSRDPARRRDEVQTMSPVRLELVWSAPGGQPLEAALHVRFAEHRAHGEWFDFKVSREEAVRVVAAEAARLSGGVG